MVVQALTALELGSMTATTRSALDTEKGGLVTENLILKLV